MHRVALPACMDMHLNVLSIYIIINSCEAFGDVLANELFVQSS